MLHLKAELASAAAGCYALAITRDSKICFTCCSHDNIAIGNLGNQKVVKSRQLSVRIEQNVSHTD